MEWKDVGETVKKYAPLLGAALGGPAGGAAGGAVSLLLSAFGVAEGATPDTSLAAILSDPDMALKLKDIDMKHREFLSGLAVQTLQAELADVKDARAREVAIVTATGKRDVNIYILAWVVVGGFIGLTALLTFRTVPEGNLGPVNQLYGAMAMGFGAVIGYFFGSSQSSDLKTRIMGMAKGAT